MKKTYRLLSLILAVLMTVLSLPMSFSAKGNTEMTIFSIQMGEGNHGEATLVKSGVDFLLMDFGITDSFTYIENALKDNNVTHLSLYLSHFHGDHTGGIKDSETSNIYKLINNYDIDKIYLPHVNLLRYRGIQVEEFEENYYRRIKTTYEKSHNNDTKSYDDTVVYLAPSALGYENAKAEFSFGTVKSYVIGPLDIDNFTSPFKGGKTTGTLKDVDTKASGETGVTRLDTYQNNCSLVTKLICGKVSYLSAGDTKTDGENSLISAYGDNESDTEPYSLKSTIYKITHHGHYPATSPNFTQYIKPDFSFVSNYASTGYDGENRKNHVSHYACRRYGFTFLCGEENMGLKIAVINDSISLYKYGSGENGTNKLNKEGWCRVIGNNGTISGYDYFYFGKDGKTLKGVQFIDGKYYYLGTGGAKHTGTYVNGVYKGMVSGSEEQGENTKERRYYDEKTGAICVGFCKIKDKSYDGLYYFDKNGVLVTGNGKTDWELIKIGGSYYYMYKSGFLKCDGKATIDGKIYYFGKDGKAVTGWQTIGGKRMYFYPKKYYAATGFSKINGNYYIFTDYGTMMSGSKRTIDGKIYYFGKDGKAVTGWQTIGGKKMYFDKKTAQAVKGLVKIGSGYYFFNDYGFLMTNTKKVIGGNTYTFDKNGKMTNVPKAVKVSVKKATGGKRSVKVTWDKKSVHGYEIYISSSKSGKYTKAVTATKNATSATVNNLKAKTSYYVKIRSYVIIGSTKQYSSFSKAVNVKTK